MDRKSVLLWIIRSTAALLVAGLILIYYGAEKDVPAAWISGIAVFAVGGGIALFAKLKLSRPSKALLKRWAGYLTLPDDEVEDYAAELDEVENNFAADADKRKNRFSPPGFAGAKAFCDFSVLQSGRIFYGCIVQANELLFERGKNVYEALPAVFIYSPDEFYKQSPDKLIGIADALYADKANNRLRNETKYEFNNMVDPDLTDDRKVYMTDILVSRNHLPMGMIGGRRIMPIIADPKRQSSAFVVDCKYWTDKLINEYITAGEDPPDTYGDPFGV